MKKLTFIDSIYVVSVKSLQLCPTLCDPMGHRILEWVAIPFSRAFFVEVILYKLFHVIYMQICNMGINSIPQRIKLGQNY